MRLILLILCFTPALFAQTVTKVVDNGPDDQRINFVVVSEGYQSFELPNFRLDADALINSFWANAPWGQYSNWVNIYYLEAASAQSGADHPSSGTFVNTRYDASFSNPSTPQLLTVNYSKVYPDLNALVPSYDLVLVVVNDLTYGGSGGAISVCSIGPGANSVCVHEVGHTFAGLADEYESPFPGYPPGDSEPNVTYQNVYANVPWKDWIPAGVPVPTVPQSSYPTQVGLFEGARYLSTGIYRPKRDCAMRTLGGTFCEICREAHVLEFYRALGAIADASPGGDFELQANDPIALSVTALTGTEAGSVTYFWTIDGAPVGGNTSSLNIASGTYSPGVYTVECVVNVSSSYVRNDPQGYMSETMSWQVGLGVSLPSSGGGSGSGGGKSSSSTGGCATTPTTNTLLLLSLIALAMSALRLRRLSS